MQSHAEASSAYPHTKGGVGNLVLVLRFRAQAVLNDQAASLSSGNFSYVMGGRVRIYDTHCDRLEDLTSTPTPTYPS